MAIRNLDIDLLRTFVTIVDSGGFSRAGERLGRTQSTVSLQVKRLEEALGRPVFERNPHRVHMTPDGERLLGHARKMLRLNDALMAEITEPDFSGQVRLGVPEDFATIHLPDVLAEFTEAHPLVELSVTCDLTLNLLDGFGRGDFDMVLVKREPTAALGGTRVWREPLVWVARDRYDPDPDHALPLILSPQPCVYRKRAIAALEQIGTPWRIAYSSTSLAGTQAAVRAGLGVTVLPREMCPSFLSPLGPEAGLPPLEDTEIALIERADNSFAAQRFGQHIIAALERQA